MTSRFTVFYVTKKMIVSMNTRLLQWQRRSNSYFLIGRKSCSKILTKTMKNFQDFSLSTSLYYKNLTSKNNNRFLKLKEAPTIKTC